MTQEKNKLSPSFVTCVLSTLFSCFFEIFILFCFIFAFCVIRAECSVICCFLKFCFVNCVLILLFSCFSFTLFWVFFDFGVCIVCMCRFDWFWICTCMAAFVDCGYLLFLFVFGFTIGLGMHSHRQNVRDNITCTLWCVRNKYLQTLIVVKFKQINWSI